MKTIEVRRQTFADVLADKTILELEVVFSGTFKDCIEYCQKLGFVEKPARNQIYGVWYYNKEDSIALMLT